MARLRGLLNADLERSGITLKEARKAGVRLLKDSDSFYNALHPKHAGRCPKAFTARGYTIAYYLPDGKRLNFIRVRKLSGYWNADSDDAKREKQNYSQPPNSLPHIYHPVPVSALPEPGVSGKIKVVGELVITEGEKKCLVANLCGIPCVALGGVWNFRSAKHFTLILGEFTKWFDLSEADLIFVFDVDVYGNKDVRAALYQAKHAIRQHVRPRSISEISLTSEQIDDKIGFDDWLADFENRQKALRAFEKLERTPDVVGEIFSVYEQEICYVEAVKKYFDIPNRKYFPTERSIVEQCGSDHYVPDPHGPNKKPIKTINLWLDTRETATSNVHSTGYEPGKPERFKASKENRLETINEWRRSDLDPIPYSGSPADRKDLALFFEYFENLTSGLKDSEREWFKCWLAYPLQCLGAKLHTAVCAFSMMTRTGKSTVSWILRHCYGGHNSHMLRGITLNSQYNDYLLNQWVYIEEVHTPAYGKRGAVMQTLKTQVTDEFFELDRKYMPITNARSHANYYFTTNHKDALLLEESDARFFILHVPEQRWDKAKFNALFKWLKEDSYYGCARVYGWLLSLDTSAFDPTDSAPRTAAWNEMFIAGLGSDSLSDVVKELIDAPVTVIGTQAKQDLVKGDCDLFTPLDLVHAINSYSKRRSITFKGELNTKRLGQLLRKRMPRKQIKFSDNVWRTLYAVYDRKYWAKAKKSEWRKYWKEHLKPIL